MDEKQKQRELVFSKSEEEANFDGDGIDIDEIPGIGNMSRPNTESTKKFMM
jgi:hypothetical protein